MSADMAENNKTIITTIIGNLPLDYMFKRRHGGRCGRRWGTTIGGFHMTSLPLYGIIINITTRLCFGRLFLTFGHEVPRWRLGMGLLGLQTTWLKAQLWALSQVFKYGSTSTQRNDHADASTQSWTCFGSASGFSERTNHSPCCCFASTLGSNFREAHVRPLQWMQRRVRKDVMGL